ncbi:hypothetical protein E2C01_070540 [Portunus trituberculatus]|uniref:Uncharacterized protein n=1 Tax=Portunus trituberculatus TaxID=210409 RepID=A0A5B7I2D7_PORTR|nr:hypothetical protein [Portunus trituberculatus]
MRTIITFTGPRKTRIRQDYTFRYSGSTRDGCDNIIGRLHVDRPYHKKPDPRRRA